MSALSHRLALRGALTALALALIAYGIFSPGAKVRVAPPLPRATVAGRAVTVADLRGHPTAVVFFASWCPDCHTEAPAIARFAVSPAGRGRLVAVDDDDYRDPRQFVAHYHWGFPVLSDPSGNTSDAYEVAHLPTTVILNAKGEIVAHEVGPQTVASLTRALSAAS